MDHDVVEEKNLVRQNFCKAEVGYPKAFSLAWRYTAAYGLRITPLVEHFSAEMLERCRPSYSSQGTLTLVVGAVDNVAARREIAEAIAAWGGKSDALGHQIWWIDAGNERVGGQVLIGNSLEPEPLLSPLGYCTGLLLPHLQEPGLLVEKERPAQEENLSCAELVALAEQGAMINRVMADVIGVYLYRLLQSRDLDLMATWVDLTGINTRSVPITSGRLLKPEQPAAQPQRERSLPAEDALPGFVVCHQCGVGALIEGEDEYRGVLISVRFYNHCTFREEGCPHCGGTLIEDQVENMDLDMVPALVCEECDWYSEIPPAYVAAAEN